MSLGAGFIQLDAGLLQGYGGGGYQNAYNAAGTLGFSLLLGNAITGPNPTTFMSNTAIISGGAFDATTANIPQLGPSQASCPP